MRSITLKDSTFVFEFSPLEPGFFKAKDAVKELPGRRFDPNAKVWTVPTVPAYNRALVAKVAQEHGFVVSPEAGELLKVTTKEVAQKIEASRTLSSEPVVIPGLGERQPFPFQHAGIRYLVENRCVLVGDQMGLGKTGEAICAVAKLDAFPCVVVCPASLKLNWAREWAIWQPSRSVVVVNGQPPSDAADVYVVNYDVLSDRTAKRDDVKRDKKAKPVPSKMVTHFLLLNPQSVVFDESHYLKSKDAQRSQQAKLLAESVPVRFGLSGTATLNKPIEIVNQLDIIGRLDDMGGWWQFVKRYCDAHQEWVGRGQYAKQVWVMGGQSNLDELNTRLRATCYVRREKLDVLTELPPKMRAVVPLEYNRKAYQAVADEFQEEEDRAEEEGYDLPEGWHLKKIGALRQAAVEAKLDNCVEWIENFLESGEKLVVFAWHQNTVRTVAEHFKAPFILGDTPLARRQANVDTFQNDPSCKVIVLNIQSGGVGLTLTAASNVVFLELPWRPGDCDQAEDRCHRIGQHDQVTAHYLIANGTIEDDIADLLVTKRAITDRVNEGNAEDDSSIVDKLVRAVEAATESGRNWQALQAKAEEESRNQRAFFSQDAKPKVRDGYYTVVNGATRLTLRLKTWKSKGDGSQIASYLYGSNNTHDYKGFAVVRGGSHRVFSSLTNDVEATHNASTALMILLGSADPALYGQAYALESKRCWVCNRLLTTKESITSGIGPECSAKLGIERAA